MKCVRPTRKAFGLIDLLCTIAIIIVLLGMFFPSIQNVRESARRTSCLNTLRQLVLAAHNFESARDRLPPGTLGFRGRYDFNGLDIGKSSWYDPTSSQYWQRAQHTSSLVLILPFLEQSTVFDTLPLGSTAIGSLWEETGSPHWIGDEPTMHTAMYQTMPMFLCPSDRLDSNQGGAIALLSSQPAIETNTGQDGLLSEPFLTALDQPAGTNYVGCGGAHSGGRFVPPDRVGFRGVMSCRDRIATSSITDGASNTIIYGENIGAIAEGKRQLYFSWMFGGLARGRSNLPWQQDINPQQPEYLMFGDSKFAYPAGFGSMHPGVVNFAYCDGSVKGLSRFTNLSTFYALCGGYDGTLVGAD